MAIRYTSALAAALSLTGVVCAAAVARDETSPLQIPRIQVDPSRYVDPDFPGLAFEQASFVNYALNNDGTPNVFSQNLINGIFARTGGKPLIRLGGTAADYARFVADQTAPALPRAEADDSAQQDLGALTIGPAYWDLVAGSFPSAQYIVQLPMADPDMARGAVRWATTAAGKIGLDRIHSFEPGNEPDLYPATGLGPPRWQGRQDNGTYVANFLNYCDAVAAAVGLPRGTRKFQALDTASHPADPAQDVFSISLRSVYQQGLDNHHAVKTVARHYYQTEGGGGGGGDAGGSLATGLMNHGAIAGRLDVFRDDLEFLASRSSGSTRTPYVLSEVGSSQRSRAKKADYASQATLGAALWQVDFQLYGLSLGVARFHFQQAMRAGGGSNLWLPGASGNVSAQVFARYYAQPFVADFVGAAGTVQVKNVPLEPNVSAYVAYEAGTPRRVAVVNLGYWSRCRRSSSSSSTTRRSQKVRITAPAGVAKVRVVHLTSPQGATARAKTVTYAGSQWTYESLGKEVKGVRNDGDVLTVQGGVVDVPVKESEAVIVHFL
ncbi:glycoside hydrolase family 79 protein [Beauveria brongniartii RCEF 3172]|uniref:Glycoside hydrolase family 79 protein n=1 Tax=Beauveria brongniartii RCEF 3172 TaxID=1081107 RepID=A0A162HUM8_9HYPO|nr:glycoside hydrolase family 79 protein [Beauveria brongniartii RCEF 3172]